MTQDTSEIKNKIISFLRRNGPSLPVHIAREIELSTLFTSAFLSELLSERRIKTSHMRVGNSPLYLLSGQEFMLERFSFHLKSKEKDAYALLKEKKFLDDAEQEPAIRVALREIKDFAVPFKKDERLIWRFFHAPESDLLKERPTKIKDISQKIEEISIPMQFNAGVHQFQPDLEKIQEKSLDIFDKPKIKRISKAKKSKKKPSQKDSTFFNRIKEFLAEKSIEIMDILSFSKNEILLKIKNNGDERILIAYNKKKISDSDVIKASKKASEFGLFYDIICLYGPLKKIQDILTATKNLGSIEKLR
ncbi:hypothetical protein FJZ20_01795 [Candidatus Pacearchaeota archaeon]|nr:hypothetical protein [Candidatus Pacearchaeota archaeon]